MWVLVAGCVGYFAVSLVVFLLGRRSGSVALVAEAVHLASDGVAVGIALWAELFAKRDISERYTFGRWKAKALAAVGSVLVLAFVVVRDILPETLSKFWEPQPIRSTLVLLVAIGVFGWNALLKFLFRNAPHEHHFRGARLKVNFDFYGVLLIVAAALAIKLTGWLWLDAVASFLVVAAFSIPTWRTFAAARDELLDKAPPFPWAEFRRVMRSVLGVVDFHEVHLRQVGGHVSMTLHVIRDPAVPQEDIDRRLEEVFHGLFKISHHTIRTEVEYCGEVCVFLQPTPA